MHDISIISMVFTAVLALGCLYLILSPLFKWDSYLQFNVKGTETDITKESLLTTLNELEFEYKMDKISPADYKVLKRQYEEQVAMILKEEEKIVPAHLDEDMMAEVEKEIEMQMLELRRKKGEAK